MYYNSWEFHSDGVFHGEIKKKKKKKKTPTGMQYVEPYEKFSEEFNIVICKDPMYKCQWPYG